MNEFPIFETTTRKRSKDPCDVKVFDRTDQDSGYYEVETQYRNSGVRASYALYDVQDLLTTMNSLYNP